MGGGVGAFARRRLRGPISPARPEGGGAHAGGSPGYCVSSTTVLQSMKLGVDVNRHKEVIVKAISAVLLLLLKHFKLNHVYQVPVGPSFLFTGPGPQAVLLQPRTEALPFKPPRALHECFKTQSSNRGLLSLEGRG